MTTPFLLSSLFAFRGVLAIFFGLVAIFWPVEVFAVLIVLFGIYLIVDGASIMGWMLMSRSARTPEFGIQALACILVGISALIWPVGFERVLLVAAGLIAVLLGALGMLHVVKLKSADASTGRLSLSAIVALLCGVILLAAPLSGAVVISCAIGLYALLYGVALLTAAHRLRHHRFPNDMGTFREPQEPKRLGKNKVPFLLGERAPLSPEAGARKNEATRLSHLPPLRWRWPG
jgi:uncharacterized membrane protein HdeD (DUF308 family)